MLRIRSDERLYQSTSRKLLQVSRIVLPIEKILIPRAIVLIELIGSEYHPTPGLKIDSPRTDVHNRTQFPQFAKSIFSLCCYFFFRFSFPQSVAADWNRQWTTYSIVERVQGSRMISKDGYFGPSEFGCTFLVSELICGSIRRLRRSLLDRVSIRGFEEIRALPSPLFEYSFSSFRLKPLPRG